MDDTDRTALSLARIQGGVITTRQTSHLGFTRGQIGHRLATGAWTPVYRLGYRIFDASDELDVLAAATTLLPKAVVSFASAAALHGIDGVESNGLHVSTHSRTTHSFDGVVIHRCHDLEGSHIDFVGRLPTTSVERTIVDLAMDIRPRRLAMITGKLLDEGRVDTETLVEIASRVGRRGKPGTVAIREVIEWLELGDASPLEARGRALLASSGALPPSSSEYPLPWAPHRRFDDAFPDRRLAIEWDSFRFHGRRDSFERDRARDREALAHGWRVMRFTWRNVVDQPDETLAAVEAAYRELVS